MPNAAHRRPALVIAAHGDRGADKRNDNVRRQVDGLRNTGQFARIGSGFLKGDPEIETALQQAAEAADEILVYPLFMSDGYFTNTALPNRIEQTGLTSRIVSLKPLGLDPGLAPLCERAAVAQAERDDIDSAGARLLIVGHGSTKSPASKNATQQFAARLRQKTAFGTVESCFLEEEPFLKPALANTDQPTIVAGFFAGDGLHGGEDVPELIAETGANASYMGALGGLTEVTELILAAVRAHLTARG
jgi:sirohydrochlorin ferrochelatase